MGEEQEKQAGKVDAPHKGRGGARPGAGRKAKWGEKTVVMRVPESMREAVEEFLSLKAQGVELVRGDEVDARIEAAVQAAMESTRATEPESQPVVHADVPEKPKKSRAPRKKKAQDTDFDPARQGSLFDLL